MHLTRRSLAVLAPAGLLAATQEPVTAPAQQSATGTAITVVLVRHAETEGDTKTDRDPSLSAVGRSRATELAGMLGHAGVTHAFASEYKRTQQTVGPLAAAADIEAQVLSARDPKAQVQALLELAPGSIAVVAGHSNTIPALVEALGGRFRRHPDALAGDPTLLHGEYGRLFVVSGPASEAAATLELRYAPLER